MRNRGTEEGKGSSWKQVEVRPEKAKTRKEE